MILPVTLTLVESVGWFLVVGGGAYVLGYAVKDWEMRTRKARKRGRVAH